MLIILEITPFQAWQMVGPPCPRLTPVTSSMITLPSKKRFLFAQKIQVPQWLQHVKLYLLLTKSQNGKESTAGQISER